ncbi:MAG: glucose-1-phosphate thymidylyltransferase RfbA [Candidatus Gracilibacteria bacterium]|nr:glucose-1-phosphate thymidylyltransferase RfbA [Candidatus Gracilibacteria bacterium]
MKGIILAGGTGTRLYPITMSVSKQLMPIYDKPMIYYPLSVFMMAGIKDILIITTSEDQAGFKRLLGDGQKFGINLKYEIQPTPDGLAQAFIIGESFIGNDNVALILGDNLFYGQGLSSLLKNAISTVENSKKSVIFGYGVNDPERYGVVEFDENQNAISIEEKPKLPKSNFAVVGLYFYTNDVVEIAKTIKPSLRGELEITSVNEQYLHSGKLCVEIMNRGYAWLDTGTHESMLDASNFIQIIEARQGLKIGCIEEIAYLNNWINNSELEVLAKPLIKSNYGKYLLKLVKNNYV